MDGPTYTRGWEGKTLVAKPDAKGFWVIGIGHDIPAPAPGAPVPTCTDDEAEAWYASNYAKAITSAQMDVGVPLWASLSVPRQAVLNDMAFELGRGGLAEFKAMIAALGAGDWARAHDECLASAYGREVPNRASSGAQILLTGEWPDGVKDILPKGESMADQIPISPVHVGAGAGGAYVLMKPLEYLAGAIHMPPMDDQTALGFGAVLIWGVAALAARKGMKIPPLQFLRAASPAKPASS